MPPPPPSPPFLSLKTSTVSRTKQPSSSWEAPWPSAPTPPWTPTVPRYHNPLSWSLPSSPLWMYLHFRLLSRRCRPRPRRTFPRAGGRARSRSSTGRWPSSGSAAAAPARSAGSPRGPRGRRGRDGRWSARGRRESADPEGAGTANRPRLSLLLADGTSGAGPAGGRSSLGEERSEKDFH